MSKCVAEPHVRGRQRCGDGSGLALAKGQKRADLVVAFEDGEQIIDDLWVELRTTAAP